MDRETRRHEITKRSVVYELPGIDAVTIRRDVEYRVTDAGALTMDFYYPPDWQSRARLPAVVFVLGFSDLGAEAMLGCKFKEMQSFISWARLVAASGMVAITYTTGRDPAADIHALLRYVRQEASSLGVKEDRIGLWACSGHVPNALSLLMHDARDYLRCAALCYGFMLDAEGSTRVADAAEAFRFVNPCAGRSVDDLPRDIPLLVVRAGQDETPHLNETIDHFVLDALSCNLSITLANHPAAQHAFDVLQDSETSRAAVKQVLAFMRAHLPA